MSPRHKAETPQDAVNGTFSAQTATGQHKCRACLKPLPPGSGSRYCCSRCRLRGWAVRDLAKALHDGTLEGLREALASLGEERES